MEKHNNILGGFETVIDSFIPKTEQEQEMQQLIDNEDDLEFDKNNIEDDPIVEKMKKDGKIENKKDDDPIEEPEKKDNDKEEKTTVKVDKNDKKEEDVIIDNQDDLEPQLITNFFDAIAERLNWNDVEDEDKPKDVDSLIDYFQKVIEEDSKPTYASEEMENLDNFVKQGGELSKYLKIEQEFDLDNIDLEDENNQKSVVKLLLREKGFNEKQIDKKIQKYEDAGLLEDEAEDALEDLKEIKEQKKEQLLAEQKRTFEEYKQRQQDFYNSVTNEIKDLKNIRGIAIPEKDKKVLIDYILKPDSDGKTKYQKDYAKDSIKNLIESAYFTMNADKLIEAAKREGSNTAINKFKNSLKNTSINSRSKTVDRNSDNTTIWNTFTRQLRAL